MKELEEDQIELLYWEFKDRQSEGYSERDLFKFAVRKAYVPLKADNLRLANLVTKFDTALRTIAAEAGMEEAYSGVDTEEKVDGFIKAIRRQQKSLAELTEEVAKQCYNPSLEHIGPLVLDARASLKVKP